MRDKAAAFIKEHSLLGGGERVVAALSGGADSVALLHFLFTIKEEYGLTLTAAHLNHNLRGDESLRDERFVRELCAEMGIPLSVRSQDIARLAGELGIGLEECGRRRRYAFFDDIAGKNGVIATAHTLSDSAETFFINLLRGTGLAGLCGIPARRGNIIRPLLSCTRADIIAYCRENRLNFVEDSSNADDGFLRNRIRHHVIPALESAGDRGFYPAFGRMLSSLSEDERYLSNLADKLVKSAAREDGYDAAEISRAPAPAAKRALKMIITAHAGVSPGAVHIEKLYGMLNTGGALTLPGGLRAGITAGKLNFPVVGEEKTGEWLVPCVPGEWAETPAGRLRLVPQPINLEKTCFVHKKLFHNTLDCAKIMGKILFRNRRQGDFIRLAGRNCTKTIKKLFCESKILPGLRDNIPFLQDDLGIVWIKGFGVCERCAPGAETLSVYRIEEESSEGRY